MKHIAFKSLSWLTKISLVLLIIAMLAVGGFAIRLAQGPIDLEFAKDYVQEALSDKEAGYYVSMNKLMLEWSDYRKALLLTLDKVSLSQGEQVEDLNIEKAMLGISAPHLLVGQVLPTTLVIEEPILRLIQKDGAYDLFWTHKEEEKKSEEELPNRREIQQKIAHYLEQISNPTEESFGRFAALKEISLRRAIIQKETRK